MAQDWIRLAYGLHGALSSGEGRHRGRREGAAESGRFGMVQGLGFRVKDTQTLPSDMSLSHSHRL